MLKVNKYLILLLFLLSTGSLFAQVSESEYKAAFIERFTRFVEWPDGFGNDIFKIVVIGKTPLKNSLNELFTDLKIKGYKVDLIYTDNIADLRNANLVFISASEKRRISDILLSLEKDPVLTISDSKGFSAKGVHINMFVSDNYIRYEINQIAIEKSGLEVSSLLLTSAKIVKTDD